MAYSFTVHTKQDLISAVEELIDVDNKEQLKRVIAENGRKYGGLGEAPKTQLIAGAAP